MKQEIMKQEEKFMEQQVEKVLIKWMLEHIHNYITSNYSKVDLYDIYVILWEVYQFMTYDLNFEIKDNDMEFFIKSGNGSFEF